jgi:hypothetical protein
MADRSDLQEWVIRALRDLGAAARIVEICRNIWEHHEDELRRSGDLFFTWQYEMRWAGQQLRDKGVLRSVHGSKSQRWELAQRAA